jgi:hypothetical protein
MALEERLVTFGSGTTKNLAPRNPFRIAIALVWWSCLAISGVLSPPASAQEDRHDEDYVPKKIGLSPPEPQAWASSSPEKHERQQKFRSLVLAYSERIVAARA